MQLLPLSYQWCIPAINIHKFLPFANKGALAMLLQVAGVDPFLAAPLFKVTGHRAVGTAAGMTKRVEERQLLSASDVVTEALCWNG